MMTWLRANRIKMLTGFMLAATLGVGAKLAKDYFSNDCCAMGASCCKPGAACCHHGGGTRAASR